MLNPFEITVHNQAEDEEILHVWRHHWITLVPIVFRIAGFMLVPILLLVFTGLSMFSSPWLFGLYLAILAVCITYAAYEWASWYGDVYVLTNYRVIDVEQQGFFHRRFAEASLGRIQDVSYDIAGIFQSVFGYGDVLVQTAGSMDNVTINDVTNPAEQTKLIVQEQEKYHDSKDDDMTAEDLIKLLNKHHKNLEKLPDLEKKENLERTRENLEKVQEQQKKTKSFRKKKKEAEG